MCPRCTNVKMTQVQDVDQSHITLDACPECLGVYFDAGEFKDFAHFNFVDYLRGLFHRKKKK
jgi:Zn-finger nucleic acid-binding protein